MRLGIRLELEAALRDRCVQTRRGQRVLQCLARAHMHQHVARGDDRQAGELRHPLHTG